MSSPAGEKKRKEEKHVITTKTVIIILHEVSRANNRFHQPFSYTWFILSVLFVHRQPANVSQPTCPDVVCVCVCAGKVVCYTCVYLISLSVKRRGRQVKREMEKERDMSQHPQDVFSFWAAVVWELEAALRRPVNSFSHRSPRACKTGTGCPLSLAMLFRPLFLCQYITNTSLFSPPLSEAEPLFKSISSHQMWCAQ